MASADSTDAVPSRTEEGQLQDDERLLKKILRTHAYLWLIVGLFFFVASYYWDKPSLPWWGVCGIAALRLIGTSAFAVGGVRIFFEIPSITEYIENRMSKVLLSHRPFFSSVMNDLLRRSIVDPAFIGNLGRKELEAARHRILEALQHSPIAQTAPPYIVLTEKIEPLLSQGVLTSFTVNLTNEYVTTPSPHLKSRRYYESVYSCPRNEKFVVRFKHTLQTVDGIPNKSLCKVHAISVNGVPQDKRRIVRNTDKVTGALTVKFESELAVQPGQTVTVTREETVLVPAYDTNYIHTVAENRSMSRLTLDCRFTNVEVYPNVRLLGFGEDGDGNPRKDPYHCHLEWNGWMIPHQGFLLRWRHPGAVTTASPSRASSVGATGIQEGGPWPAGSPAKIGS